MFQDVPGAVVSGAVKGGTLTDTLELVSSAGVGIITGIGSQFTGFEVLTEAPAPLWQLTGANTLLSTASIGLGASARLSVAGSLTSPADLTISGPGTLAMAGGHVGGRHRWHRDRQPVAVDAAPRVCP